MEKLYYFELNDLTLLNTDSKIVVFLWGITVGPVILTLYLLAMAIGLVGFVLKTIISLFFRIT